MEPFWKESLNRRAAQPRRCRWKNYGDGHQQAAPNADESDSFLNCPACGHTVRMALDRSPWDMDPRAAELLEKLQLMPLQRRCNRCCTT